jgi:hypothetical protein
MILTGALTRRLMTSSFAESIKIMENSFTFCKIGANDKSFNSSGAHTCLHKLGMT